MPPSGPSTTATASARRFRIALSFPGTHRDRVKAIADLLAQRIEKDRILYDHWYRAEFARPDLDIYLPPLYRDQSELVVVFLAAGYEASEWCGLEWRYIREVIKARRREGIMFLRFDQTEIPGMISGDGYIDISQLPDAEVAADILTRAGVRAAPTPPQTSHPEYTQKLPTTHDTLIGRDRELAFLEAAWNENVNLVQIIAPGGTGKTALVTKWYKSKRGQLPIYGYSFYRQGTTQGGASSDDLLDHALHTFHLKPAAETADARVEALVEHLRLHRTLVILDGLEPLQATNGDMLDYALKDLLRLLAAQNPGLVLCTTRRRLTDIEDDAGSHSLDLDDLHEEDGARYLREKFGVEGSEEDLRAASREYGNHALALTLLGTWLKRHGGDLSRRYEIKKLPMPATKSGDHAKRVMQSYADAFRGKPEADLLRALGFFDRPAERDALRLVMPNERIPAEALLNLQEARLVLTADAEAPIDCHPLVREYFGEFTRREDPDGFRAGHSRLFDHYCQVPKEERPRTIQTLTPLFQAVAHGCHAGRHQEALDDVYFDRVLHGNHMGDGGYYLSKKLGAFGANLSLLSCFFEYPAAEGAAPESKWSKPVVSLPASGKSALLGEVAFSLYAAGRLADAVSPMRARAEERAEAHDHRNAAISYSNFSQILLSLGRITEGVEVARRAVCHADRATDTFQRIARRSALADALHQAGEFAEAITLFVDAERHQAEDEPEFPMLNALAGYQYCDLLLDSDATEVLGRGKRMFEWRQPNDSLLTVGLDHLTLGRAHPCGSAESRQHLDQAVATLRRAGQVDFLPKALLARATEADLAEVHKIATRSGMLLHLTDYHLAMARRHNSLDHLEKAEALIAKTGYHRRDAEAAQLRATLTKP